MLLENSMNKSSTSMAPTMTANPDPTAPSVTPPVADVIFLVECNANLGPYIETLKNVYINPALLHFNGGPSIDGDYGVDRIATMYSMVPFLSNDCLPSPPCWCVPPTTSTHKVKFWFEKLSFLGGGAEERSHVTEALANALQAFDDFDDLRSGSSVRGKVQKYCILICNSAPYPVVSQYSLHYPGFSADGLVAKMADRGIHFSIFSPRRIPELHKLFHAGGVDNKVSGDFAWDPRHLVLLRGFSLPVEKNPQTPGDSQPPSSGKKTPIPSSKGGPIVDTNTAAPSNKGPMVMDNPFPVSYGGNTNKPPPMQITTAITTVTPSVYSGGGGGNPNHPQYQPQPSFATQPPQLIPQQPPHHYGGMPPNSANNLAAPAINPQPLQHSAYGIPPVNHGIQSQQHLQNQQPPQPGVPPSPTPPNVSTSTSETDEKIIIWNGTLEWQEKGKGSPATGAKVSKTLMCHASVLQKDKQDINTDDKWPKHLIMQLIPQQLLAPLRPLISKSRTVEFHFAKNDQSSLESLHNVMETGFSGCVHFGNNTQCDIKVLMLLYNKKTRGFIGFIPTDQNGFVNGIHQIITEHKEKHQRSREAAESNPGMSGLPTTGPNNAWPPNNQNPVVNQVGPMTTMQQQQQQLQQQQVQLQQQQQQLQQQQQAMGMIRGNGPMVNMIGQQNQPIRIMQIQQPQMQSAGQPVQLRNLLMANQQQQQQQQQPGGNQVNNAGPPQQWMRQSGPQMMHSQMIMNRGAAMPQGGAIGGVGNPPSGAMMMGQMRGGNPMGIMTNVGGAGGPVGATQTVVTAQAQQQQQQQQQNPDMWG